MNADLLRRAATLMRERAAAATGGGDAPWVMYPTITREEGNDSANTISMPYCPDGRPGDCRPWCGSDVLRTGAEGCEDDYVSQPDAEHITSWHPAVALAVADWIDLVVTRYGANSVEAEPALGVARAYLGES